ncbi:hypothetical protein BpHYR1_034654 [Brachionus plicatilis]|uniref:Uncharacterized protein n=1 Tax=Brachionus plicatilis TaxID=10195 RepID=A0A3M7SYB9_BRAPC|nr:hypothetical protein BpHYR1_034654 [Brachionus plicatilis]
MGLINKILIKKTNHNSTKSSHADDVNNPDTPFIPRQSQPLSLNFYHFDSTPTFVLILTLSSFEDQKAVVLNPFIYKIWKFLFSPHILHLNLLYYYMGKVMKSDTYIKLNT